MEPNKIRSAALARQAEALSAAGRPAEADACRLRALALLEARACALFATELWKAGAFAEAEVQLERAIALDADDGWRIRRAALLPMLAANRQDIEVQRARMEGRLRALLEGPLAVADPAEQIAWTGFLLAYHGEHGNAGTHGLFHRVCSRAAPGLDWVAPHCRAAPRAGGRGRVGFISWYFREHTISRLFTGLIEQFDGDHFDVTVFAFVDNADTLQQARLAGKRMVILPADLPTARQAIAQAELDVLVYLDLGMDPFTLFLAHARLAPLQAVLWGHPDTTALPTIDVFLSCDAMEPDDGDSHYSERLVRLPGPGTWYARPPLMDPPPNPPAFGLPDGCVLYLCPQTPQKFHPDFDPVLRRILEADPRAHLVLTAGWAEALTAHLVRRIFGPAPQLAERVHVLGPMDRRSFIGLMQIADVLLDPPHYSGGNTTLEALASGAPVITWPGRFMRARHTFGFYKLMGVFDCVAERLEDYAPLALAVGANPARRQALRQRLAQRSVVLYENDMTVRAMEAFFASAIR